MAQRIRDLYKYDRPREKLIKYGPQHLSDHELLALILGSGTKKLTVLQLAQRLLRKYSCQQLTQLSISQLRKERGIGVAKAAIIVAAFELGRRFLQQKPAQLYLNAEDAWRELKDFRNKKKEYFIIFFLDSRHREIKREIISIGTLNSSLVHPREVFEPAIRNAAAQILLAHNHPSGDPRPSSDDLKVTRRLIEAGKILGIEILDHVIISEESFFSFREQGLLKND